MIRLLTWPARAVCWAIMVPAAVGIVVSAGAGKLAIVVEQRLKAVEFAYDFNRLMKRNPSQATIEG